MNLVSQLAEFVPLNKLVLGRDGLNCVPAYLELKHAGQTLLLLEDAGRISADEMDDALDGVLFPADGASL